MGFGEIVACVCVCACARVVYACWFRDKQVRAVRRGVARCQIREDCPVIDQWACWSGDPLCRWKKTRSSLDIRRVLSCWLLAWACSRVSSSSSRPAKGTRGTEPKGGWRLGELRTAARTEWMNRLDQHAANSYRGSVMSTASLVEGEAGTKRPLLRIV